jgi:hypothetical protein
LDLRREREHLVPPRKRSGNARNKRIQPSLSVTQMTATRYRERRVMIVRSSDQTLIAYHNGVRIRLSIS